MPKIYLSSPIRRLCMLAYLSRLGVILLLLSSATELAVALALRGLGSAELWVGRVGSETHLSLVVTAIGVFLMTLWLSHTGIGEGPLYKDLDLAHQSPNEVFQFRRSIGNGSSESPVWSPDARWIAFTNSLSGTSRLMVSDLPGRFVRPLGLMAQVQAPDWSRSR